MFNVVREHAPESCTTFSQDPAAGAMWVPKAARGVMIWLGMPREETPSQD